MKALAAVILALITALPGVTARSGASAPPERDQVGYDVSAFSSVCVTGEAIDGSVFAEYGVSAVVYWATWSEDCRRQIAILDQIGRQYPEYGVMGVLHVDATSTEAAALAFLQENGYRLPVFTCDTVWAGLVSQAQYIPQCFIIDASGHVTEVWHAAFSSAEPLLERLLFWSPQEILLGDVDLDGAVTALDALLLMRAVMGLDHLDAVQTERADLDGDGRITALDALILMRGVMGLRAQGGNV